MFGLIGSLRRMARNDLIAKLLGLIYGSWVLSSREKWQHANTLSILTIANCSARLAPIPKTDGYTISSFLKINQNTKVSEKSENKYMNTHTHHEGSFGEKNRVFWATKKAG